MAQSSLVQPRSRSIRSLIRSSVSFAGVVVAISHLFSSQSVLAACHPAARCLYAFRTSGNRVRYRDVTKTLGTNVASGGPRSAGHLREHGGERTEPGDRPRSRGTERT